MGVGGNLIQGLEAVLQPHVLLWLTVGVLVGMVIGVLPGLGASAGMALLLPLTFTLDPLSAMAMLAAIYYAVMYGSVIGAIMLNMPADDVAIASTFDGYPLTRQGRAGPALVMQAVASFVGGTIGVLLITFLAPSLAKIGRAMGPSEFFMLVLLALLTIAVMIGGNWVKGVISALAGFALGTIGTDVINGQPRLTFGTTELLNGIDFIPLTIGIFAIGEILRAVYEGRHRGGAPTLLDPSARREFWPSRADWRHSRWTFPRASFLGFVIGVIPGAGSTIASMAAYALERAVSKTKERFGKGAMEGLVAAEAANNSQPAGAMVPLLTLGIPGSAATAILLSGMILLGLQPGPLFMTDNPDLAWGIISSMYVGNVMLVAICIIGIPLFVKIAAVPYRIVIPVVVIISAFGSYLDQSNVFDVWVMLAAGVVGFFMIRFGFSPAALVIALILGPLAEASLRRTLIVSDNSLAIFVERPISLGLTILFVLLLMAPPVFRLIVARRARTQLLVTQ